MIFGKQPKPEPQHRIEYRVVELEKRAPVEDTKETRQQVASLQYHVGFLALLDKLNLTRAALKARLEQAKHEKMEDVIFLQAGLYWSHWLKQEVDRAGAIPNSVAVDPFEEELKAFRELDALVERVGGDEA